MKSLGRDTAKELKTYVAAQQFEEKSKRAKVSSRGRIWQRTSLNSI